MNFVLFSSIFGVREAENVDIHMDTTSTSRFYSTLPITNNDYDVTGVDYYFDEEVRFLLASRVLKTSK